MQSVKKILFSGIFLIPLLFNPWSIANPYELTKQSWLFLLVGIFLLVVLFGLSVAKKIEIKFNKIIFILLVLWAVSFIASTVFSISPIESFWGSYERMQGALTNIIYLVLFAISFQILGSQKNQNTFFWVTLAVGAVASLHAIYQKITFDPSNMSNMLTNVAAGRSFAAVGNPTGLGQFLIFPIFAGISLMALNFAHAKKKNNLKLILLAALLVLSVIGLWLTQNRASILGIAVSCVLFIFYIFKNNKKYLLISGLVLILLMIFAASKINLNLRSMGTRAVLWEDSISLVSKNPVFGSGPETYYQTIQTSLSPDLYLYERMTDIPDRSHNEFLDMLLTQGIFGAALYLINIFFLVYIYFKKKINTIAAKTAFFCILAYTISVQFSFSQVSQMVSLTAMWAILLLETVSLKTIRLKLPNFKKIIVGFAVILCSAFLFATSYKIIKTETLFTKAVAAYLYSPRESFSNFEKAINNTPQYAYLYQSLFIFFSPQTDPSLYEGLDKLAENFGRITNYSFQYQLARANVLAARGNWEQAQIYYGQAEKKAPNWGILWLDWGRAAFDATNFKESAEKFEKFVELAPPYWRWKTEPTLTAKQMEDYRIFSISNSSFYEALSKLIESYGKLGQKEKASALQKFL